LSITDNAVATRIQLTTASGTLSIITSLTGEILGESWTDISAGSETWTETSVGSETWSDATITDNVWSTLQ